jgi:prophage regulatory protein
MTQPTILRLAQVIKQTGVSRSFIYSAIKAGTFPASIKLGARAIGFHSDKIDNWITSRTSTPVQTAELKQIPQMPRRLRALPQSASLLRSSNVVPR